MRMSMPTVTFSACIPPLAAGIIVILPDPELFGFTDVTSNAAPVPVAAAGPGPTTATCCARTMVTPATNGTAIAVRTARASMDFFQPFRPGRISFVMMCSIRFFSSEPVMPETQASGDSTSR